MSLLPTPTAMRRSVFLAGAAALAGCGGGRVSTGLPRLGSGWSRAVRSISQSTADYTLYTSTPNGYSLMQSRDGSTMGFFDPQGSYLFGIRVTSVDDTYMYVTAQNNASRFTPLTVSQAIRYNLAANTTYHPDAATSMSYTPDPNTGNPVVTATNDVGTTTVTPISSSQTDYTDTQGMKSQRVNVGMNLSSSSGNGQTCGGHICAYVAPRPTQTPGHARQVYALRQPESASFQCVASAGATAGTLLNLAGKFFKVGLTSGGIVVAVLPEIDLLGLAAGAVALGVAVCGSYLYCYAQNQAKPK